MQDILATYLFQQKSCPLPGIGSLIIKEQAAMVVPGERKILPPVTSIELSRQDIPVAGLLRYISSEQNISGEEAQTALKKYCSTLKYMGTHEEIPLPGAGHFAVSPEGKILFTPENISAAYMLPVTAEKVIRPNDPHAILVGDTETTNTVMSEFYSDEQPAKANSWWIAAVAVAVVSAVAIFFYFSNAGSNGSGGNAQKITPQAQDGAIK